MNDTFRCGRGWSSWGPLLVVAACACAAGATLHAEEADATAAAVPADLPVDRWIAELDHDDYHVRQRATEKLREAGAVALDALVEAARGGSLEASVRSFEVFERVYARAEGDAATAAEDALDRLEESENFSVAARAREFAEAHYEIRERRAIARIEQLGGVIDRADEDERVMAINGRVIVRQPSADGNGAVESVRLDPETWKGGAEGLKHVKRLTRLNRLYVVDGAVTEEQRKELIASLPHVDVQDRGRAFLGIKGVPSPNGSGCVVLGVQAGAAAAKAGLQQGDVIVGFGDEKVPDFPTLIDLIAKKRPGDEVVASIERVVDGTRQTVQLPITLGRWSDTESKPEADDESGDE